MSETVYEIVWSPTARRNIRGLPEKVATAVAEFVYGSLATSPQRVGKPLGFELTGHHTARRGDFRVIYTIDEAQRQIEIVAVAHRSDVYRRR